MSVTLHTLSNGFRVVCEVMPGLKSSSVGVWVNAGGRHERPEQNGVAHFLEHMAFKGTSRRTALQIAEEIEDVGGFINAYTSREVTAYYARVLEDDVALALDVIADILLDPVFDAREIEVERGVILQEIGQALDTPDDIIFDWLQEKAYPDQAIGRTILGEADRVRGFSRDDLQAFVAERYGPEQMILAAAGAVDPDEVVQLAEKYFGHLPARQSGAADVARFVSGERRVQKDLEQAHIAFALEGPNYRDPAIFTAQVFGIALGGGMSSRLFQEVREKRGLCYSIFAQTGAYADTGMLTIYAGTSGGQIADLAEITMNEIRKAADNMSAEEIARARIQMKAGLLMGLESPSNRAERLARMLGIWGRIPTLEETISKIEAVDLQSVRDFGRDMVTDAGSALALYGPVEHAPGLDEMKAWIAA